MDIDPGVRSFQAWYSADQVGKLAEAAFFRIQILNDRLKRLGARRGAVTPRPCVNVGARRDSLPAGSLRRVAMSDYSSSSPSSSSSDAVISMLSVAPSAKPKFDRFMVDGTH